MYKLTDSEIRFLLKQDQLTKIECIALLTGGYEDITIIKDYGNHDLSLKLQGYKDILSQKEPIPKNPQHLGIYNKIIEVSETMGRSLGFTLMPLEDMLDLSVIGADDPTFETRHFLEWAHQKGFIPPSLSQDLKPFLNTLTAAISTKPEKPGRERTSADSEALNMLPNQNTLRNDSDTTISKKIEIDPPEIISSVLTKSWEPERPINRLSQNRELGIWNKWIQPIVDRHYNGVFGYIYFKEAESIDRDDIGALWEQHIAPFICSNLPQWIKYPQSFTQAELESRISENIWEPNLFISEVVIPLKAGRGSAFVDPFLRCLTNIIHEGDLPAFLTYLEQERGGAVYTMEQPETIHEAQPVTIVTDKDLLNVTADSEISSSNSSEEGFYNILEKYHADIGMFWESLSRKAKDRHGSIEVANGLDLYDLAKEAYTENSQHFVALKLADIDNRDYYSSNAKPKRKIVGSILQKIFWREQPHMFGHPEIRNNTQWLFNKFNDHGR